jgi:hypothetical protein
VEQLDADLAVLRQTIGKDIHRLAQREKQLSADGVCEIEGERVVFEELTTEQSLNFRILQTRMRRIQTREQQLYVLGNPDIFNMHVSDSLTRMKDATNVPMLHAKRNLCIASWLKWSTLSDCAIKRKFLPM